MSKLVAVALLWILLAVACTRGTGERQPPADVEAVPGGGSAQGQPAGERPRQTITLEKVERGSDRPAPAARPAPARAPLPAIELRDRVMPEDFQIGPLQDQLQTDHARMVVLRAADRFLLDLSRGRVNREYLYPPLREELYRSLTHHGSRDLLPDRYRLGRVALEEPGEARLPLRLFRGDGSAEGDLYLSMWDGSWYVSDIQVGFELLGRPRPAPEGRYMPAGRGW